MMEKSGEQIKNAEVAAWIGCTAEQVRIMRLHKWTCESCVEVHPSYPQIMAFHSPLCKARCVCAYCGGAIDGLFCEHLSQRVGAICHRCADDRTGESTSEVPA